MKAIGSHSRHNAAYFVSELPQLYNHMSFNIPSTSICRIGNGGVEESFRLWRPKHNIVDV